MLIHVEDTPRQEQRHAPAVPTLMISDLDGRLSPDGRRVTLLAPLHFLSADRGVVVTAEAGFVSDFNSSPRILWRLFAPWEYPRAGVIHDHLYISGDYPRAVCDDVHRDLLVHDGMPAWKASVARGVLRVAGWKAWNRDRRADQQDQH